MSVVALVWAIDHPRSREGHDLLRQVYTPHFAPVPEPTPAGSLFSTLWNDLRTEQGRAFLNRWVPSQAGTLWLALLVVLVVGYDFAHPRNPRNVDLVAAQAIGFLFFDILVFTRRAQDPLWLALAWWIFDAVFALSLLLAARAVWRVRRPFAEPWQPVLPTRALATVAMFMLALDVGAALVRAPDDAGYFVNLGAQRFRERGRLPYGDPLLTGTPGAAYGPLLYVAHVPFQLMVDPVRLNETSSPRPPLGEESTYYEPSPLATRLCTIAFQLLAAAALLVAGRRFGSPEIGWAIVALYCGSAFVLGMGGDEYFIGGMTYVSHIGPAAVVLSAFAALGSPASAGALLVAATGCGFFPAFLFPAWAGHFWDRRRDRTRFLVAVALAGAALAAFVLLSSRPAGGRGLIGTILWDTFGHHSDPQGYGASPFGFWGQRGGWRAWMMHPLVGTTGLTAPALVLFYGFAASCFFLARRRGPRTLALISAAIVIGSNLVKIHATGTYVEWFYPLLLLGWFLPARASEPVASATISVSSCPETRALPPS